MNSISRTIFRSLALCVGMCIALAATAQRQVLVNLSMLDGIDLTLANIFNYQVVNSTGTARDAKITGTVTFKNTGYRLSYTYDTRLQAGSNFLTRETAANVTWTYSNNALKELFMTYNKLPQGTYEYCVSIQLKYLNAEQADNDPETECIYQNVSDLFLINLVDPENDAKIYELYPSLSWVVNYPFASELTYRVRVAELKKGQNNENAITRNNPFFEDHAVTTTTIVYPVTAKPLQKFQPYVWTVDAFYKGVLLGGAEVWKFTIIEDTLLKPVPADQSYYEFASHIGETKLHVTAEIKLKYRADGTDTFSVRIADDAGKEFATPDKIIPLKNGYNWIVLPIYEKVNLRHGGNYNLYLVNKSGKTFQIPFQYTNPLFIKQDEH